MLFSKSAFRVFTGCLLMASYPLLADASEVWRSTFDTAGGFDGMVEFQSGNPDVVMFNPAGASGGKLLVTVEDGKDYSGQSNKGGRLLNSGGTAITAGAASF